MAVVVVVTVVVAAAVGGGGGGGGGSTVFPFRWKNFTIIKRDENAYYTN